MLTPNYKLEAIMPITKQDLGESFYSKMNKTKVAGLNSE